LIGIKRVRRAADIGRSRLTMPVALAVYQAANVV